MAQTIAEQAPPATGSPRTGPRSPRPVLLWASAGVAALAFQVFVLARWVLGPDFTATPTGDDPLPRWQHHVFTALQIGIPIAAVVLLYLWIVRPWRREGHLTTGGMIALSASMVFFWDMTMNYTSITLFYNSHLVNMGSWADGSWPGWTSPSASNLPEPLLIAPPAYTALVYSQVVFMLWVLRRVKARWPRLGPAGTIAFLVAGLTVTDTVVEGLVLRTGVYAYPGAIREITLFAGETYQIPMSETVLFGGLALGSIACLSHFRDNLGRTVAERGLDRVNVGAIGRQWLKFFAIFGAIHLAFLVLYMVPQQWFATHSDPFPEYPSYLENGMCVSGNDGNTCPGPGVPMPRRP